MVSIALFLGAVIGIPLGVLLVITRKQGIWPNIVIHQVFKSYNQYFKVTTIYYFVNCDCTIHKIHHAGTSIGTTAAIVPLTVYVAPYIARLVKLIIRSRRGDY